MLDLRGDTPNAPVPENVRRTVDSLLELDSMSLHGYTTAAGYPSLRGRIAEDLNERFGTDADPDLMYITFGAAAAVAIALRVILLGGEEVLIPAPCEPEYRMFVEAVGGIPVVIPPANGGIELDLDTLEKNLGQKTGAVILNQSGLTSPEGTLEAVSRRMRHAQERTGKVIFLISDERFRELAGMNAACAFSDYENTMVCCSFSQSMSIPGERLGYVAIGAHADMSEENYAGVLGAGRAMGYVNPPSLFQHVVERCLGQYADFGVYRTCRDALTQGLTDLGYACEEPANVYHLFVKTPESDDVGFCRRAAEAELLLTAGSDLGCPGWIRLACTADESGVAQALSVFRTLN